MMMNTDELTASPSLEEEVAKYLSHLDRLSQLDNDRSAAEETDDNLTWDVLLEGKKTLAEKAALSLIQAFTTKSETAKTLSDITEKPLEADEGRDHPKTSDDAVNYTKNMRVPSEGDDSTEDSTNPSGSFDDILDVSEDGDPPDEIEAPDNACVDEDVGGEKKKRLSETIAKLQKVKETLSLLKSRHSKTSPPRTSTEIVEEVAEVNPDKTVEEVAEANPDKSHSVGSIDTAEISVEERGASDTEEEFEAKSDMKPSLSLPVAKEEAVITHNIVKVKAQRVKNKSVAYSPLLGVVLSEYQVLPEIMDDEVLIRVEATSISTRDCLEQIRRINNDELKDELWVPGHEIVGRVVRAGREAKFLKKRRVAALLRNAGGNARYVRVHIDKLMSVPETASSKDLVYLLSTYMTAYQCLERALEEVNKSTSCVPTCGIKAIVSEDEDVDDDLLDQTGESGRRSSLYGKNVLIVGAGSPVGMALVELSRNAGARVYALSHSQHERALRKMNVYSWCALFDKDAWSQSWKGSMDVIIDTIGDYDNYTQFYNVMGSSGKFLRVNTTSSGKKFVPMVGVNGEKDEFFSLFNDYKGSYIHNNAIDYNIFDSFDEEKELFTEDFAYLHDLLQCRKIKRRVFSDVGFHNLEEEWQKFMGGKTKGNGIIVVSPFDDDGCNDVAKISIHHDSEGEEVEMCL